MCQYSKYVRTFLLFFFSESERKVHIAFQSIVVDVFGQAIESIRSVTDTSFAKFIASACKMENIQCTDYILAKIQQAYDLLNHRPGIIFIGEPYSGKTTAYRILAKAIEISTDDHADGNAAVEMTGNNNSSL